MREFDENAGYVARDIRVFDLGRSNQMPLDEFSEEPVQGMVLRNGHSYQMPRDLASLSNEQDQSRSAPNWAFFTPL
ncbi:MAG TPA: hypothetical protein VE621_23265 [Bryobacteraceae bacterium]|nr:hypothetical protein [Bryobacteraceae bacterium]